MFRVFLCFLYVNVLIFVFVFAIVLAIVFMGLYLVTSNTKVLFVNYLTRPEVEAFFISSIAFFL